MQTARRLAQLPQPARLTVLSDGSGPAAAYAQRITGAGDRLGIAVTLLGYSDRTLVDLAQGDEPVLALLPLPDGLTRAMLSEAIGADRDVEGLHPAHLGQLVLASPTLVPPTAQAALYLAEALAGTLKGKTVTVVGASAVVGCPLTLLLLAAEATVSVAHAATGDLIALTHAADIVISAAGVPGLITAAHIRPGAIIVDVGLTRTDAGLCGDVDITSVMGKAAARTHVPDGVGPVTTACLMRNVVDLAARKQDPTNRA
ncbi:hypothetical protein BV911_05605 [Pseudoruegeria sp. SK021]|nr:hypothetical protein BV911_05605 [Pseudoruegeria sp. SK021]